jgi:dihydrofolate reductase
MLDSKGNAKGRSVTLHMVSSLDGFIARNDNSVSWLVNTGVYQAGVSISKEEAGLFVKGIDCYVLGSRTYDHALELGWPYGDTPTVVGDRQRMATGQEERRVLFRRSQDIS